MRRKILLSSLELQFYFSALCFDCIMPRTPASHPAALHSSENRETRGVPSNRRGYNVKGDKNGCFDVFETSAPLFFGK